MSLFSNFSVIDTKNKDLEKEKIESIIENFNHILNTRKGFGSFLKDYGIRDLGSYTSRDHLIEAVKEEIEYNIKNYEPRLKIISIEVDDENDSPFLISFKIQCKIIEKTKSIHLVFDYTFKNIYIK